MPRQGLLALRAAKQRKLLGKQRPPPPPPPPPPQPAPVTTATATTTPKRPSPLKGPTLPDPPKKRKVVRQKKKKKLQDFCAVAKKHYIGNQKARDAVRDALMNPGIHLIQGPESSGKRTILELAVPPEDWIKSEAQDLSDWNDTVSWMTNPQHRLRVRPARVVVILYDSMSDYGRQKLHGFLGSDQTVKLPTFVITSQPYVAKLQKGKHGLTPIRVFPIWPNQIPKLLELVGKEVDHKFMGHQVVRGNVTHLLQTFETLVRSQKRKSFIVNLTQKIYDQMQMDAHHDLNYFQATQILVGSPKALQEHAGDDALPNLQESIHRIVCHLSHMRWKDMDSLADATDLMSEMDAHWGIWRPHQDMETAENAWAFRYRFSHLNYDGASKVNGPAPSKKTTLMEQVLSDYALMRECDNPLKPTRLELMEELTTGSLRPTPVPDTSIARTMYPDPKVRLSMESVYATRLECFKDHATIRKKVEAMEHAWYNA